MNTTVVEPDSGFIDCDAHWHDTRIDFVNRVAPQFRAGAPRPIPELDNRMVCDGEFMRDASANFATPAGNSSFELFERRRGMWDSKQRLADINSMGVDKAVIFGSALANGIFGIANPEMAAEVVRVYHDALAEYCAEAPDRMKGVAVMALQGEAVDVIRETERAITELGFVALHFPSNYRGQQITDREFRYVLDLADSLNVPLMIHPGTAGRGIEALGTRDTDNLFYRHTISLGVQMMNASLHLVCEGLFDEFPNLRVAFLESGVGWLPHFVENADAHYERLAYMTKIDRKPSEYFRSGQMYFYAEPGDRALAVAIELVGENNFIYASDYWHWDADPWEQAPGINAMDDLTATQKEKILVSNGKRLFNFA